MKEIVTKLAPKAIGPYSQGIVVPNSCHLIFVSGQLPVDSQSGKLIEGEIQVLTAKVIDNIEAILKEAGSDLTKVIRTEVFLTNLKDFSEMNKIYSQRFRGSPLPARQTIQVSALPLGSLIEISCIAWV